jgi:hypothetical protein
VFGENKLTMPIMKKTTANVKKHPLIAAPYHDPLFEPPLFQLPEFPPPLFQLPEFEPPPQFHEPEFEPLSLPQFHEPEFEPLLLPQFHEPEFEPLLLPQFHEPEFEPPESLLFEPQPPGVTSGPRDPPPNSPLPSVQQPMMKKIRLMMKNGRARCIFTLPSYLDIIIYARGLRSLHGITINVKRCAAWSISAHAKIPHPPAPSSRRR